MTRIGRQAIGALLLSGWAAAACGAAAGRAISSPAPGAEAPPTLRLPSGIAPLRYALDWTLDPARDTFEGIVEIEIRLARPSSIVWLNARNLEIREASLTSGTRTAAARIVPGGDEFRGFAFEPPVPAGRARLRIAYTGKVQATDTTGVFHQKVGDDWYAYTMFESIDARRAMPCFDEPAFKVPWRVTLRIPPGQTAVSNAPIESERDENGRRVVVFRETKPLPAYLVAAGVGPFEVVDAGRVGKNAVPARILVPRGRSRETRFAVETQKEVVKRLEAYFGIPYPYEKLDHLVIPHTVRFGAMENAGLITWNETYLLAAPEEETAAFSINYLSVALHEVAHQWFGDYVTLAWWDDTWLNESFATWMAEKILREWKPEWKRDEVQVLNRSDTLTRDTLKSSRSIRQPILSNGDIDNAFDDMSYGKGGAVLAMFESWAGPKKFQAGIRSYLAAHAWKNATAEDFLGALEKASGPGIARSFSTFLEQPGFPLITADLRCTPGAPARLALRQNRLLPGDTPDPSALWRVPVCARWGGKSGEGRACTLLSAPEGELALPAGKACPDWVLANDGEVGYYRVAYGGDLQSRLLRGGAPQLTVAERVGVLSDARALARLGRIPMEEALALVPAFSKDRERHVVSTLVEIAEAIDDHLVSDALRPTYERFVRDAFGERARELSWKPSKEESADDQLLREKLLGAVAGAGRDPELRTEGAALGRRWLDDRSAVSSSVAATAVALAAREGDAALFERMAVEVKRAPEQRDRERLFAALGCFLDPAVERRALALTLDPSIDARESIVILWIALLDRRTQDVAWEFVKTNLDAIVARMPEELRPLLPTMGRPFCDERHRDEFRALFEPRLGKIAGAQRPFAQTLERIDRCRELSTDQRAGVERFLRAYGGTN